MPIKKLDPIVASRIAAGEVVERPASALREFLDNSIDAGATSIEVYMEEGGIKSLTVKDNGKGMSSEDLSMACLSHATSKIETLDDLYSLRTLGFRGEALCSISSCSKLTIQSNGNQIIIDNGISTDVIPGSVQDGTVITMEGIFESIPARKQFLKRPSTEASECRKVFTEKALGFENIGFRLFTDGKLDISFEVSDKKTRALSVMSLDKEFVVADSFDMKFEAEPVSLYAVCSKPSIYKRDRSGIKVLVNNRVIDSYQIVQAITSSYSVALPGGAFPFFCLYITDSPSLIDFNIHPSKRECKIRNQSSIYGMITKMIRDSLLALSKNPVLDRETKPQQKVFENFASETHLSKAPSFKGYEVRQPAAKLDPSWFESAKEVLQKAKSVVKQEPLQDRKYRYLGQAFETFLIAETQDRILFIDQHAAHERILYDQITANPDKQNLMVPYRFETDISVDDFLCLNSVFYQDFGVDLVRVEPMVWEITSLPAVCRKNESEIASCIQNAPGDVNEARKKLFAIIACHSAIKANDVVDDYTAKCLLDKVFELDAMLCPHGRSFVFEITKRDLFKEVGRIV